MAAKTLDDVVSKIEEGNKITASVGQKSSTEKAKDAENRREDIKRQEALIALLKERQTINVNVDGEKPKGSFLGGIISALGLGTAAIGTLALGAIGGYLKQYKRVFLDPIFGTSTGRGTKPSIFMRVFSKIKGFFTRGFAGITKFLDEMTDSLKIKFRNTRLFKFFTRVKSFFGSRFKGLTNVLDDIGKSIGRVTKGGFIAAKGGLMGALTRIKNFFKLEGTFKGLGQGIDDVTEFFTGKKFADTKFARTLGSIGKMFGGLFTLEKVLNKDVETTDGKGKKTKTNLGKLFGGLTKIGAALGKLFVPLGFIIGAFAAVDAGFEEFEKLKKDRGDLSDESKMTLAIAKGFTALADWTILGLPNLVYDFVKWSAEKFAEFVTKDPNAVKKVKEFFGTKSLGELLYEKIIVPLFDIIPKLMRGELISMTDQRRRELSTEAKSAVTNEEKKIAAENIRRTQTRQGLESFATASGGFGGAVVLALVKLADTIDRVGFGNIFSIGGDTVNNTVVTPSPRTFVPEGL